MITTKTGRKYGPSGCARARNWSAKRARCLLQDIHRHSFKHDDSDSATTTGNVQVTGNGNARPPPAVRC